MKAIMVMYDSLNRRMLEPYGCDWVHTPNFTRMAECAATFDTCYVGSMPCMPARREIHTGRYNFLHCGWGPLEPFDDSMPELLGKAGVRCLYERSSCDPSGRQVSLAGTNLSTASGEVTRWLTGYLLTNGKNPRLSRSRHTCFVFANGSQFRQSNSQIICQRHC